MMDIFIFVHSDRRLGRWWTRGFLITDRVGFFFFRWDDGEDERRVLAVGDTACTAIVTHGKKRTERENLVVVVAVIIVVMIMRHISF
jgi:hypothetical protein